MSACLYAAMGNDASHPWERRGLSDPTPSCGYDFVGMKNLSPAAKLHERSMLQHPSHRSKHTRRIAYDGPDLGKSYVLSFDSERFYRGWRYYWMVCEARRPDELVSWGHAPTLKLAETAAGSEMEKLESGQS